VLPHNRASGHEIAKAQVGSLRGLGLGGVVLPESSGQRRAHPDIGYGQPNDGQTEHDGPDSEDAASTGVCFHGPTLAINAPKVLIERNQAVIDGSDESWKSGPAPRPEPRPTGVMSGVTAKKVEAPLTNS
jgi:hypothetical protein